MASRDLQRSFVGGEISPEMFGRPDDPRYQHAAARLENMISSVQGPAQKRPGFRFVREVKSSANATSLIPFTFSQGQTLVLEMGVATVDSREIGYFRFHTDGGTVLFTKPADHIATLGITAVTASTTLTTSAAHGMATGDPIALTMVGEIGAAGILASDPGEVDVGIAYEEGQQCIFTLNAGSTIPDELEYDRLYYVRNPSGTVFNLSETPGGNLITFSNGSTGTPLLSVMPSFAADPIYARKRFYLIQIAADQFQLAATREDAIAGNNIVFTNDGNMGTAFRVHFDYRVGELVSFGTGSGATFYCFRPPFGETLDNLPAKDHLDHPPPDVNYWARLPGEFSTVTFDAGTDVVNWTTHPLLEGDEVIFSGAALPAQITAGEVYYCRNPAPNTFQLATFPGGPVIDLLSAGTPPHTALATPVFEVPHFFEVGDLFEVGYAQSLDVLTLVHPKRPAYELRRLGSTSWVAQDAEFNGAPPPMDVTVTQFRGNGYEVASMSVANPVTFTTHSNHGFAHGETLYVEAGLDDLPAGFYRARNPTAATTELMLLDTADLAASTLTTLASPPPLVYAVPVIADTTDTYVVTTINEAGEESRPSPEFVVEQSFLHNLNAYNTVTWSPVEGAQRYRVYRKEDGIFALIGEVRAPDTTFQDENIDPDGSITPPIPDDTLRMVQVVTFDSTNAVVNWTNHGLRHGAPVAFQSSGALPGNITPYATYYVFEPDQNSFGVVADPDDTVSLALSGFDTDERHEAIAGQFPAGVGFFEQRRVFCGSLTAQQRIWATASGTDSDVSYSIPIVDSDRIRVDVSARELAFLRHVLPLSYLALLSDSTEFRVAPVNDDALTPTSISVRTIGFVGAKAVQPAVVNNLALFVANRGGHMRVAGFSQETVLSYTTGDLSLRAAHLFDGLELVQVAYAKAPQPVVWAVSSSGLLLGMTYVPEEGISGWHKHSTDGVFEAVAAVAEGMEDHVYVVVKRNINGQDVRYVERMADRTQPAALADCFYVDAGVTYDGTPTSSVFAGHLQGETLVALVDGLVQTGLTPDANGFVHLVTPGSKVQLGLAYTGDLLTLPLSMNAQALAMGRSKALNAVWLRVEKSSAFRLGPTEAALVTTSEPAAGALLSSSVDVTLPGGWDLHGQLIIRQANPLPLNVVSIASQTSLGGTS